MFTEAKDGRCTESQPQPRKSDNGLVFWWRLQDLKA